MKFYSELNVTTNDGTLIGLISLPRGMVLLVEGEGEGTGADPGRGPAAGPERAPRQTRRRYAAKTKRQKPKNLFKIDGVGWRSASQEMIAEIRASDGSQKMLKRIARRLKISKTTVDRVWEGNGSYKFLGGPVKPANGN